MALGFGTRTPTVIKTRATTVSYHSCLVVLGLGSCFPALRDCFISKPFSIRFMYKLSHIAERCCYPSPLKTLVSEMVAADLELMA